MVGAGGKAKTGFQLIGICMVLVYYTYRVPFFDAWIDFNKMGLWLVYVSVGLSIVSALDYTRGFIRTLERRGDGTNPAGPEDDEDES